jgi:hypothetical protein
MKYLHRCLQVQTQPGRGRVQERVRRDGDYEGDARLQDLQSRVPPQQRHHEETSQEMPQRLRLGLLHG